MAAPNLPLWRSKVWSIGVSLLFGFLLATGVLDLEISAMRSKPSPSLMAVVAAAALIGPSRAVASVDISWHPPNATTINDLSQVIANKGVYGFVYNSSTVPQESYGIYNWCNMPHVRATEYKKPPSEYKLEYVEVIQRHHKRTVYASNSFPVESYGWDCSDQGLFYYGQPKEGQKSAHTYWQGYISPINPFVPTGFLGSCQFPQITAEGLQDSWQHGKDLYEVYHDLLGFLPENVEDRVTFRVTQNVITSQVAGMVINGMYGIESNYPLRIQPSGFDSLEPTYTCSVASNLFNAIKSGPNWTNHLTAATALYAALDDISGVSPSDSGFHASFDHYYDNLSARQCHAKPLPCKLVNGVNSTTCVTQTLANDVYRLGNYEYSYIYRDDSRSLAASAASLGVWIAELAANIRELIDGKTNIIYRHNVAHDGSLSRLLSILQLDVMVWPGMGSEVIFEVYSKDKTPATPTTLATTTPSATASCNHDNCLREMIKQSSAASQFCPTFTANSQTALPTFLSNCNSDVSRVSSACSCVVTSIPASANPPTSSSTSSVKNYFARVLWKGQALRSSNPSLGLIDMLPLETLLAYFDGLVGVNSSLVKGKCNGSIPV